METSSRSRARSWPYPRRETFVSELQRHTASYFRSRGLATQKRYPFILDTWHNWPANIILSEVAEYVIREKERRLKEGIGFPLHNYLHHGLSSQAMLLNLVGPLIVRNDYEPIRQVLAAKGLSWQEGPLSAQLEVEDRSLFNEDSSQPTSIDLMVTHPSRPSLFVEAKFVEAEFGGCQVFKRGNCDGKNPAGNFSHCYLHHIGRRYWDLMKSHGLLTEAWLSSPLCPLSVYYQFFRELLFALEQEGHFVLLHDERNPTFCCDGPLGERGVFSFLLALLPGKIRSRTFSITVQELFEAIQAGSGHGDWTGEFAEKYGMAKIGRREARPD